MSDMKISIALRLLDAVTAPLQKIGGKLSGMSKASRAASGNMSGVAKAANAMKVSTIKAAGTGFENISDKALQCGKTIEQAARNASRFGDTASRAARKGKKGLEEVDEAAKKHAARLKELAKLSNKSSAYGRAGAATTAVGAGMLASVAAPVKMGADRQAALSDQRRSTMLADGSNPMWDAIEPTIKALRGSTAKSDVDIGEIVSGMLAEGLDAKAINGGALASALKLSEVGKLDNRAAGEGLAKLSQSAKVDDYDKLAEIVQRGATAANIDYGSMMGQLSDLMLKGQERGITGEGATEGFAKMIAGLSMSGLEGDSVAPAIENLMGGIQSLGEKFKHGNSWKTEEVTGIQEKYGIGDFVSQLFDKDGGLIGADGEAKLDNMVGVFDSISKKFGDNVQDKLVYMKALFGEGVGEMMMKVDFGMMNEANAKMRQQADLNTKAADANSTLAAKWAGLTSRISEFSGGAGASLADRLGGIVDKVAELFEWLTKWTEKHQTLTAFILGTVAVIGSLLVVVGGAITLVGALGRSIFYIQKASLLAGPALTSLKGGIVKATSATWGFITGAIKMAGTALVAMWGGLVSATTAAWSFTAALLANPITWIVVGIMALAGAALLIYKYWAPICDWFVSVWGGVKDFFVALWDWFMGLWQKIPGWAQWFFPIIKIPMLIVENWDSIKGFFGMLWDWLAGLWNTVSGWCAAFWEFIDLPGLIKAGWNKLIAFYSGLWDWLTGLFDSAIGWLDSLFPFLNLPERIQKAWERLKNFFSGIGKFFKGLFKGVGDDAKEGATALADAANKAELKENKAAKAVKKAEEPAKKIDAAAAVKVTGTDNKATTAVKKAEEPAKAAGAAAAVVARKDVKEDEKPGTLAKPYPPSGTLAKPYPPSAVLQKADKNNNRSGGANNVTINYEPKLEFKGDVKDEDKAWFKRQLEAHKGDIGNLFREIMKEQEQWMGVT